MKILVFNWQDIKNPLGGGAEVHLHEVFKRIAALGHEVTLCCHRFDGSSEFENIDGIEVIRKGRRSIFNFKVPGIYRKITKKRLFDIVIDDINKIPFYTPLFVKHPLIGLSHHFFGKSIFRESGLIAGSYVYLAEKLVDKVYQTTPFVVVSQSTLQEFVDRGFNRNKFTIVGNAINHEQFSMKVCPKNDAPTVAYFGRLKKYKSIDHLLRAFAMVVQSIPKARLQILGRGSYQPELEKLAKELGIAGKTTFFGYVTEEQKIQLLGSAHVVVNTSMKEGWGITNIEANACGTPVISANVPGLKDSVSEGKSGMLYEYGDVDSLAALITDLLMNEDKCQQLSRDSVEWARSFSWDESARIMIDKCERVIEEFYR
jgi:glycosyltransferase involved in cell wall biosynthesis